MKKAIIPVIVLGLLCLPVSNTVFGEDNIEVNDEIKQILDSEIPSFSGLVIGNFISSSTIAMQYKYSWAQGHGFAAERANNLIDNLTGKKAYILGDNNARNGADRVILNRTGKSILIQTKYCKTAYDSFKACFENNTFKYYNTFTGKPMMIEVPRDQYEIVVEKMKEAIRAGKIKGINNPNDASKYIKKGYFTYQQTVNIAKIWTKESIAYDAATGSLSAIGGGTLTLALSYGSNIARGMSHDEALNYALSDSLKTGSLLFFNHIAQSQLSRLRKYNILYTPLKTNLAKKILGEKFSAKVLELSGEATSGLSGISKKYSAGRIAVNNTVAILLETAIMSSVDAPKVLHNKISSEQFAKNVTENFIYASCGTAGSYIGATAGPVGMAVGATIGSIVGSVLSRAEAEFSNREEDSKYLTLLLAKRINALADEFLLSEEDLKQVLERLKFRINADVLESMYASNDKEAYADNIIKPLILEVISKKPKSKAPTELEIRKNLMPHYAKLLHIH